MGGWGKEAANLTSQPTSSLESDSVLAGHPGGAWAGRREDLETLRKEHKALASVSLDEEAWGGPQRMVPIHDARPPLPCRAVSTDPRVLACQPPSQVCLLCSAGFQVRENRASSLPVFSQCPSGHPFTPRPHACPPGSSSDLSTVWHPDKQFNLFPCAVQHLW